MNDGIPNPANHRSLLLPRSRHLYDPFRRDAQVCEVRFSDLARRGALLRSRLSFLSEHLRAKACCLAKHMPSRNDQHDFRQRPAAGFAGSPYRLAHRHKPRRTFATQHPARHLSAIDDRQRRVKIGILLLKTRQHSGQQIQSWCSAGTQPQNSRVVDPANSPQHRRTSSVSTATRCV